MRLISLLCWALVFVPPSHEVAFLHPTQRDPNKVVCDNTLDVAIVGAGAAGTYTAHRLVSRGLKIGLFEYSGRIGGRVHSYKMDNETVLELGAMRYISGVHVKLEHLIESLGLRSKKFFQGYSIEKFQDEGRTHFYVRGQTLTPQQIRSGDIPYNLNEEENSNRENIFEYVLHKLTGLNLTRQLNATEAMSLRLLNGRPLYDITFDEALDLAVSKEGKEYFRLRNALSAGTEMEATVLLNFYEYLGDGFKVREKSDTAGVVMTVDGGMQQIYETMTDEFEKKEGHSVHLNHQLIRIKRKVSGEYVLYFQKTFDKDFYTFPDTEAQAVTVCAHKVILAVSVSALREIDWKELREYRAVRAMNALIPTPVGKVFLTFDQPWWLTNNRSADFLISDETFAEAYDFGRNQNGDSVLLASYSDGYKAQRLENLHSTGDPIEGSVSGFCRVTEPMKKELLRGFAHAYDIPVESIPEPKFAISEYWTRYPFGGAWFLAKAGYNVSEVARTLRRPSSDDDVFVVGSDYSFSTMKFWMEDAFNVVDEMLEEYFVHEFKDPSEQQHHVKHFWKVFGKYL